MKNSSHVFINIYMVTFIIAKKASQKRVKIRSIKYDKVNMSNHCVILICTHVFINIYMVTFIIIKKPLKKGRR